MSSRSFAVVALFALMAGCAFAQAPASDPQALTYAAQALSAITGGTSVTDVTLAGSVVWNGGADTGAATLKALGSGESRVDLTLSNGTRTDIRDAQTGASEGQWTNPDGSTGKYAFHNCLTDAVWFFPVFSSLAGGTNSVLLYVGLETRNGQQVQHVQSYVYAGSAPGADQPTPEQLSTMDLYLDTTTFLPAAVVFNLHPDTDSTSNLVSEVDFSDYQQQGSIIVPMRIQRFVQGAITVDLTLSSVTINSGLTLTTFQIN